MKTARDKRHVGHKLVKKQQGATLFFAMIGMVVLLLAAAALVRSVDTSTLIVGNLSFRQSASNAGDQGMEQAIQWLNTTLINPGLPAGDPAAVTYALNQSAASLPASGYYRSTGEIDLFNTAPTAPLTYAWANGRHVNLGTDADTGNTVRYVVERMCSLDWLNSQPPGTPASDQGCLFTQIETDMSRQGGDGQSFTSTQALVFRITVRVDGPRNTVSYVQGFVF